jgi:hypothetical protein
VGADVRAALTARLGPTPPLAFIKDIHYDPTAVLERLVARADIPSSENNNSNSDEEVIDRLLGDLTLEEDAGELRRGAILKVIETAAVKRRAEHRQQDDGEAAARREEFSQVKTQQQFVRVRISRKVSKEQKL